MRAKRNLAAPAAFALTWDLLSGRVTRFFCAEHSKTAFPQPYHISKLIGYFERAKGVTEED